MERTRACPLLSTTTEVERTEWIPLASTLDLIAEGLVGNADTLIALLFVLAERGRPTT
ncbi:hypothetical protein [Streptomyces sp. NPDC088755]|uniref:hypothetical protein n=1 Tax=Streptomyces sp. NPDC088755 TaxID=3365888 RepID=UPI0038007DD2